MYLDMFIQETIASVFGQRENLGEFISGFEDDFNVLFTVNSSNSFVTPQM